MGLKKCKECGGQVSDQAQICPACGAPVKKPLTAGKIVLGVIAFLILLSFLSNPSKNVVNTSKTGKPTSTPVISLHAATLFSEYESNEIRADERYKGKRLEVTGSVDSIGKDLMDDMYITLNTGRGISRVQCFFDKSHASTLASLLKGSVVTVTCQCSGKFGNVLLKRCEL